MKNLRTFLEVVSTSVSLASIFFMGLVFYNEAVLGRGVLFIEPNRGIALTELLVVSFGFGTVLGAYIRRIPEMRGRI